MSTPNFSYENRCVVVSDDDFEVGNYPAVCGKNIGGRSYASYELEEYEGHFIATKIVMTYAYYQGACINFVQNVDWIYDADYTDKQVEKLLQKEAKEANKIIDTIKMLYGYAEYKCIGVASNGEGFYREI